MLALMKSADGDGVQGRRTATLAFGTGREVKPIEA
jgi:hypothetical protein